MFRQVVYAVFNVLLGSIFRKLFDVVNIVVILT